MPELSIDTNKNISEQFDQLQLDCYDLLIKFNEYKSQARSPLSNAALNELEMDRSRLIALFEKIDRLQILIKTPYLDKKIIEQNLSDFYEILREIKQHLKITG